MFVNVFHYLGKISKYVYATFAAYQSCKILKIFYITYASPNIVNIIYAVYKSGEFITLIYTFYKTLTYDKQKELCALIVCGFIRRVIFDDKPLNLLDLVKPNYKEITPKNIPINHLINNVFTNYKNV